MVSLKSCFARKLFWKCRSIKFISKDLKKLWSASISLLRKQRRLQRRLSLDITWAFDLLKIWQISKPFYIISYTKSSWESPQYHVFYFAMYICGQSCIMSFFYTKKCLPINFAPKIAWIATSCTIQGYFEHRALSYKLVIIMIPKRQPNPAKLHVFSYIFTPTSEYFYTDVSAIDGRSSLCQFFVFNHWRCADARK